MDHRHVGLPPLVGAPDGDGCGRPRPGARACRRPGLRRGPGHPGPGHGGAWRPGPAPRGRPHGGRRRPGGGPPRRPSPDRPPPSHQRRRPRGGGRGDRRARGRPGARHLRARRLRVGLHADLRPRAGTLPRGGRAARVPRALHAGGARPDASGGSRAGAGGLRRRRPAAGVRGAGPGGAAGRDLDPRRGAAARGRPRHRDRRPGPLPRFHPRRGSERGRGARRDPARPADPAAGRDGGPRSHRPLVPGRLRGRPAGGGGGGGPEPDGRRLPAAAVPGRRRRRSSGRWGAGLSR